MSRTYLEDIETSVAGVASLSHRRTHVLLSTIGQRVKVEALVTERTFAATLVEVLAVLGTVNGE